MNIQRLISILCFISVFISPACALEAPDTVKVIENGEGVTVLRSDDTITVEVTYTDSKGNRKVYLYEMSMKENSSSDEIDKLPDDWGMDFPFLNGGPFGKKKGSKSYFKVRRDITGLRHIYWGWRFNYYDKGNVRNSFEVGVKDVIGVSWKNRGAELEIGVGFGLKRLKCDDDFIFTKEGDGIYLVPTSGAGEVKSSRLDIWAFHLPVLYNQSIGKIASFSIGGIVNFNSYAKSHTEIVEKNYKRSMNFKGLQQNLVTVDAYTSFRICGVGIYAMWSPMKLFDKEFGPELKGWSIGMELGF